MSPQPPANLPSPQLTPPNPQPAPKPKTLAWLWWVLGGVLVVIALVVGWLQLGSKTNTPGDSTQASALLVGSEPYHYPCNSLTEDVITQSFGLSDVRAHTVSEESALSLSAYPASSPNLAQASPQTAVVSKCSLSLDFDNATNKTYQLELQQFASVELAQERFAAEQQTSTAKPGYERLSDSAFVFPLALNGVTKNYFAFGLSDTVILRLAHPVNGEQVPAKPFAMAMASMSQALQQEILRSPKNFSKVIEMPEAPYADICPTMPISDLAAALGGAQFSRTAAALRHYTTPVNQSRSAPYTACELAFANASQSTATYPHKLKFTAYSLPTPALASERLNSLRQNVIENSQKGGGVSAPTNAPGLGDVAFANTNTYNANGRQNLIHEYHVVSGGYLFKIEIIQVAPGTTAPGQAITGDMAKKIYDALQASVQKATQG